MQCTVDTGRDADVPGLLHHHPGLVRGGGESNFLCVVVFAWIQI